MYGFGNGCWTGLGSLGGGSMMFILIVAVAVAAVFFVVKNAKKGEPGNDAESIVKERFARGEISADEYRDMMKRIRE